MNATIKVINDLFNFDIMDMVKTLSPYLSGNGETLVIFEYGGIPVGVVTFDRSLDVEEFVDDFTGEDDHWKLINAKENYGEIGTTGNPDDDFTVRIKTIPENISPFQN